MNTSIGASQANLSKASIADTNANNYYIARFVSPLLYQGKIDAKTWTLEYGAKESNANANFPRNGAGALYVNCYVWKPSDGTKVGTVLDGNTNADGEEAGTSQTVINATFAGAQVTGIIPGDAVLVVEIWAQVTQGNATSRTLDVYFDGTTENSTSSEAAFLSTPEDLQFTATEGNTSLITSGNQGIASTANTTQYWSIVGRQTPVTTEAETQIPIRVAGTLKRFQLRLESNSISGGSTTFTIRKNASDTGLVITVGASQIGYFEDLVNSVSVTAGDLICIKSVPGAATGTIIPTLFGVDFVPTDPTVNVQVFGGTQATNLTSASSTRFNTLQGNLTGQSSETGLPVIQRVAGKYSKFFVYISANARTTSTTFKSRKNGSDGNISVTVPAGSTGLFEDTVNEDSVSSGDDYGLASVTGSGTETLTYSIQGIHFTNSLFHGYFESGQQGGAGQNANVTTHYPLGGNIGGHSTESRAFRKVRATRLILKDLHVYCNANTVTANSTVTVRVNGVDTALTVTIGNSATGLFTDTSHAIDVGSNDDISVTIVTGATGTSLTLKQIIVYYHTGRVSKSFSFPFNIVQRISKSFRYPFNIVARISKTFRYTFNILQRVSKTFRYVFNILQRISKQFRYQFNILTRISKQFRYVWNTLQRVSKTFRYPWNTLERISKQFRYQFNIQQRISKTFNYVWNTLQRVSKSFSYPFNIQQRISKTFRYVWNQLERISKSFNYPFNILQRISKQFRYVFNIVEGALIRVEKTFNYVFNIDERVSLTFRYPYDILQRISKIFRYPWNIQERVSMIFRYPYNVCSRVSKTFRYPFNIQERISKTFRYVWNQLERISMTMRYPWNQLERVSMIFRYPFNILERISKTFRYPWNSLQRISKQFTYLYDIMEADLVRVSMTFRYVFNIQTRVSMVFRYLWNASERVSKTFRYPFLIKERVSMQFRYVWNQLERVNKTFRYPWNTLTRVSKIFRYPFNITKRVSKTFNYVWNQLERVSMEFNYPFNILVLFVRVSKTFRYVFNIQTRVSMTMRYPWNIIKLAKPPFKAAVTRFTVKAREEIPRLGSFMRGLYDRNQDYLD